MLSSAGWKRFEEEVGWRASVEIVKARMALIQQDVLDEDTCNTVEVLKALQREYQTCLWFINLPKIAQAEGDMGNEEG